MERAKGYALKGGTPWLLIVCETPEDLQSYIFPQTSLECARVREAVLAIGLDVGHGLFQEVWLFSELSGCSLRLYPTDD